MTEIDDESSGFVSEEAVTDTGASSFTNLHEIYSSNNGYNRVLIGSRYGRLHALKVLKDEYAGSDFHRAALEKEFAIAYRLIHPNIAQVIGKEHVAGLGECLIMEYIDGVTLKELIDSKRITVALGRKIVTELCAALTYIHSHQIVHRDLKPSNIMITHNGDNVKLIDFSLSDSDNSDVLKIPAGSRLYVAPEALEPGYRLSYAADIYSLGVTMWQMAEVSGDKQMSHVAKQCMRRNPAQRIASAKAVAALLAPRRRMVGVARWLILGAVLLAGGYAYIAVRNHTSAKPPVAVPEASTGAIVVSPELLELVGQGVADADTTAYLDTLRTLYDRQFPAEAQRRSPLYTAQWHSLRAAALAPGLTSE